MDVEKLFCPISQRVEINVIFTEDVIFLCLSSYAIKHKALEICSLKYFIFEELPRFVLTQIVGGKLK